MADYIQRGRIHKLTAGANITLDPSSGDDGEIAIAVSGVLVSTAFSGLAKISVGTVAPTSPATGDLWVDTN